MEIPTSLSGKRRKRSQTNFEFQPETMALLKRLTELLLTSQRAVVEQAIRDKAKKEGIHP